MTDTTKVREASADVSADPFVLRDPEGAAKEAASHVHIIRKGVRCITDKRGEATPGGGSPLEIVVDATEGFVPLWARNTTLRWRFADGTLQRFQNPVAAGAAIERLLGEAILAWGNAAPVRFTKKSDAWDFEVAVTAADDCDPNGCVLASAFFPDAGQHQLNIYPILFRQPRNEQVETLAHEIGHVFGLRHFFALVSEQAWPAEIFGTHHKFTIMNYGEDSRLTQADRSDLRNLYQLAWSGQLTNVNGTPIRLVKPYHELPEAEGAFAIAAARA